MSSAVYVLPVQPVLSRNDGSCFVAEVPAGWFGDYPELGKVYAGAPKEFTLADALAASGDYFITLATRLDKLAQGMPQDSSEQIELEHQVRLLFYMQDHYDMVAKYKRQK